MLEVVTPTTPLRGPYYGHQDRKPRPGTSRMYKNDARATHAPCSLICLQSHFGYQEHYNSKHEAHGCCRLLCPAGHGYGRLLWWLRWHRLRRLRRIRWIRRLRRLRRIRISRFPGRTCVLLRLHHQARFRRLWSRLGLRRIRRIWNWLWRIWPRLLRITCASVRMSLLAGDPTSAVTKAHLGLYAVCHPKWHSLPEFFQLPCTINLT